MPPATVVQINVSNGGVPKTAIPEARVDFLGIDGDAHNDRVNHGGPDRALCLFSAEVIDQLRSEGHPLVPGGAGENLTVRGLDWSTVRPGARFAAGDVELEITAFTSPCKNIAGCFLDGDFGRISVKTHPLESRVYARVVKPGVISQGAKVVGRGQA
ncbi:MAG: MOSC domain-containing protein [Dehalococcoidia bacterium]|nr:MOSC domain-containing protein [Dehalococcoidia bacterium]